MDKSSCNYRWYQISLIVFISVFVNFFGRFLTDYFNLPLWLDSIGTFLTAYFLGPVCGILVGVSGNILRGFVTKTSFAYSLTSIVIALVVGWSTKHGGMKTYLKTLNLSVLVSLICALISSFLNIVLFNGRIGNVWGQGISDFLENMGWPFIFRVFVGQFYIDFLDKFLSLSILFCLIKFLKLLRKKYPYLLLFDENSEDKGNLKSQNELKSAHRKKRNLSNLKCLVFFVFLCLNPLNQKIFASINNYNSYVKEIFNKENGLPSGKTNAIASTNDGLLWIGTYEGLYRYSGNDFQIMKSFDSIKTVRCLYVDNEGRLFVGTNDEGVSVVINEEVTDILDEDRGLPNNSVRCITKATDGFYYIGTSGKLAISSLNDGFKITKIISDIEGVNSISADEKNHVALVTNEGDLFILSEKEIRVKIDTDKFICVSFSPDGFLYAVTEKNEIKVFAIDELSENNSFDQKKVQKVISVSPLRHVNSLKFKNDVLFLCADNGIGYYYDDKFQKIETGNFNNSIDNMEIDFQENLWFTSSRLGLMKLCKSPFSEIYSSSGLNEVVVNSITKYKGNFYFATDNGLSVIDGKKGHSFENEITRMLKNTRVRCLLTSSDNSLWICTKSKGLICYTSTGEIIQFWKNHQCRVVKELFDGTIIVGANDGIAFIKDNEIVFTLSHKNVIGNVMILSLDQALDGTILAGTDGGGLIILEKENPQNIWKIKKILRRNDGLHSNVILRTVNDLDGGLKTGNFFVITSNGICYLKKVDDDYKITYLSNFPYTNNYDMVILPNKQIFVLSSAGIFCVSRDELLSGEKLEYQLMDLKKGLQGSLTVNSWNYIDNENNLYLSCDSGASIINLNHFNDNYYSYRLQLKSILIDGNSVAFQKDKPCVISVENERIEIFPEIVNYSINDPVLSIYLEGVDESPKEVSQSNLSSFIYNNLKPGEYKFHVGVLDNKGIKVIEDSVYSIIKEAHFYDNWWFLLYLVIVAMIAIAWLTWYITFSIQSKRIENQQKEVESIKKQVRMVNETIFAIANSVEARDKSTGKHSLRVAEYSVIIAKELGYSDTELENLHKIGLLHDIGKIGVPDSILNKPARLTDEEFQIMKTHVNIGGEILKDFTLIPNVAEGAKYHHERFDGKGYPNGLKGEEIPLNARIIGIADAFDAMTANRVYRKAQNCDYVVSELNRCRGSQFDPHLVDIVLKLIQEEKITVIESN